MEKLPRCLRLCSPRSFLQRPQRSCEAPAAKISKGFLVSRDGGDLFWDPFSADRSFEEQIAREIGEVSLLEGLCKELDAIAVRQGALKETR